MELGCHSFSSLHPCPYFAHIEEEKAETWGREGKGAVGYCKDPVQPADDWVRVADLPMAHGEAGNLTP